MKESYFQDEVLDNMYLLPTFINGNIDPKKLGKIDPKIIIKAKGHRISSTDKRNLYYTCDSSSQLLTDI